MKRVEYETLATLLLSVDYVIACGARVGTEDYGGGGGSLMSLLERLCLLVCAAGVVGGCGRGPIGG